MSLTRIVPFAIIFLLLVSPFPSSPAASFTLTIYGNVYDLSGKPAPVGTWVNITTPSGLFRAFTRDEEGSYTHSDVSAETGDIVAVQASIFGQTLTNATTVVTGMVLYRLDLGLRHYGVDCKPPEDATIDPGASASYTFRVNNSGNGDDRFELNVYSESGWPTQITSSAWTPLMNASEEITVVVLTEVPPGTESWAQDRIVLEATSVYYPWVFGTSQVTSTVNLLADFEISAPLPGFALPEQTTNLAFNITNNANGNDSYDIHASASNPASVVEIQGGSNNTGTVERGQSVFPAIQVTMPSNAMAGECFDVTLNVTSATRAEITGQNSTSVCALQKAAVLTTASSPKQAAPGSTARLLFDVKNTGNGPDTFSLQVSSSKILWAASISGGQTTTEVLLPGVSEIISVNVTLPPNASESAESVITLKATSNHENVEYSEASTSLLAAKKWGVSVSAAPSSAQGPGQTVLYPFTVKNDGNGPDSFTLSPFLSNSSWYASVEGGFWGTGAIAAGDSEAVNLMVNLPANAPAGYNVSLNLTATSLSNASITDSNTTVISVLQVASINVSLPLPEARDPGFNATFNFTVTNSGNGPDTFTLQVASSNASWNSSIANGVTSINLLQPGQNETVTVNVTVPASALAGSQAVINVTFTSVFDTSFNHTSSVVAGAKNVSDLSISSPALASGLPNAAATLTFHVKNTGNSINSFNIWLETSNASWQSQISGDLTSTGSLQPGESMAIEVEVTIHQGAMEGETLDVILLASPAKVLSIVRGSTGRATAQFFSSLQLTAPPTSRILPGSTEAIEFVIENTGNGPDAYFLEVFPTSSLWPASLHSNYTGTILPNKSKTVEVLVSVPPNIYAGAVFEASLVVVSLREPSLFEAGNAVWEASQVVGLEILPSLTNLARPGKNTTVVFKVTNTGNGLDTFNLSAISTNFWNFTILNGTVTTPVSRGRTTEVWVNITVPISANMGDEAPLTISAESVSDLSISAQSTAKVTAKLAPAVEVTSIHEPESGFPGDVLAYTFRVKNTGNGPDNFHIESYMIQTNWQTFVEGNATVTGVLQPAQHKDVRAFLRISPDADVGNVPILAFWATSVDDGGFRNQATVSSSILQVGNVNILEPLLSSPIAHNSFVLVPLRLFNSGNGADSFKVSVFSSDSEWHVDVSGLASGSTTSVGTEKTAHIILNISTPSLGLPGRGTAIIVDASSAFDPTVSQRLIFRLEVNVSNMAPEAVIISPPGGTTHAPTELFRFETDPYGDPDSDILSFRWTSSIDGTLSTAHSFETTLSPGEHTITLTVTDPFGAKDTATIILIVESPIPASEIPWTYLIIVVSALIAAALVFCHFNSRKP